MVQPISFPIKHYTILLTEKTKTMINQNLTVVLGDLKETREFLLEQGLEEMGCVKDTESGAVCASLVHKRFWHIRKSMIPNTIATGSVYLDEAVPLKYLSDFKDEVAILTAPVTYNIIGHDC